MRLSDLQKYILIEALEVKDKKLNRQRLVKFYEQHHQKTKPEQRVKVITRSLERLIDKEMLTGYGVRTPHKWFIQEIKLTRKGRQEAFKILGEQQKLPFKRKAKKL